MSKQDNEQEESSEKTRESSEQVQRTSSKLCLCGFDRHHYMISVVPTYTRWGAFWVTMMGVSSTPIRIDFVCRVCKTTFDRERNPEKLRRFL